MKTPAFRSILLETSRSPQRCPDGGDLCHGVRFFRVQVQAATLQGLPKTGDGLPVGFLGFLTATFRCAFFGNTSFNGILDGAVLDRQGLHK